MPTETQPHYYFIVNPLAGGGKAGKLWPGISHKLKTIGIAFESVLTSGKMHACSLTAQAIAKGYRRIIAVGGDGTAHEVANGILGQTTCPSSDVLFSIFPIGTGNDWIKEHRIPNKLAPWIAMLQQGKPVFQDAGQVQFQSESGPQNRYFINVAGLAYDAFVVRKAIQENTFIGGKLGYLWLIFRSLFAFKIPKSTVIFEGKEATDHFYSINIGICRFSGGGIQMVPQAKPNNGLLALTLVKRVSKMEVLLVTPLFYLGKIGWHPAVKLYQTQAVTVESAGQEPVFVEADGEFLGQAPVQIAILPQALQILVP